MLVWERDWYQRDKVLPLVVLMNFVVEMCSIWVNFYQTNNCLVLFNKMDWFCWNCHFVEIGKGLRWNSFCLKTQFKKKIRSITFYFNAVYAFFSSLCAGKCYNIVWRLTKSQGKVWFSLNSHFPSVSSFCLFCLQVFIITKKKKKNSRQSCRNFNDISDYRKLIKTNCI